MSAILARVAKRMHRQAGSPAVPRLILMTDERQPDPVRLVAGLPAGSLVILRHYGDPERAALGRRLAMLCRERRLLLSVAADATLAAGLRADGIHCPRWTDGRRAALLTWARRRKALVSVAVHTIRELSAARRIDADVVILSPVFATASHPGAKGLGLYGLAKLARVADQPKIGLGGMRPHTAGRIAPGLLAGLAFVGFG